MTSLVSILRERPAWRLAAGAMMLGFAPILVRASASPPTTSAFYRMLIGGLLLLTVLTARRRSVAVSRRFAPVLAAGGIAFAFDLFFWHRSIHIIGPGLATLLSGFQVFILAVVGILFMQERVRWQLVVAVPAAFFGVSLIIGVDWSELAEDYRLGVLFGLATACCYSTYLLIMRWARVIASPNSTPMAEVAWMSLACAAVLGAMSAATGESLAIQSLPEAILLAGYALLAQLGLVVISSSLDKVATSLVGLLLLLEPTFAYVWDLTFFSRPVAALELAGAALTIFAIYLGSRNAAS